jgi:hypothetical protein
MNTKLKASIEEAIDGALNKHAEDGLWEHYIHTKLVRQMTDAAEIVFDASQDSQTFFESEQG